MSLSPAVGELAPDFELPDENGRPVRLSDFRGRRVVLYFYPKDDTTGCTAQACGFRDAYAEIEAQNAVVIGLSPDGQASHHKFKTKYNLPFILLVDEGHRVADRYGVWGEKSLYGVKHQGILRSHFIIDAGGRIADAQVKVSPANSVARALASLKA
ncbi:MAG: thioredoxin-dependent thiol peroxidase [Anaerolineales bacterium]|nr:thioredoxin-dependent thiol peroxidase [Anaerolineales bacterium]